MNAFAKVIVAAAAVLVVVIGGYQFLPWESRSGGTNTTAPPVGPAGNGVIAVGKDGDIFVADRPGGDLRPLVAGPGEDSQPMFSPDGTRLAFVRASELPTVLMVADADGTNVVQLPMREFVSSGPWSFAPDGRSLMTVADFGGAKRVVIRPAVAPIAACADPHVRELACLEPAAAPTVLDVRLPDSSMVLMQSGGPSFNPMNAEEVLVLGQRDADGPRGIYVYDLATGAVRTVLEEAGDQYVFDVAWLPDGEHITYRSTTSASAGDAHVVAADGSRDQAFDALAGQFSPFSNDGTRIVAERDGEGGNAPRPVILPINGDGEPVVLACGPGTDIVCPVPSDHWVWSPDDSMLIGIILNDASSSGEGPLTETYLLVDAHTGQMTELDWRDVGTPAWQRVAP